MARRVAAVLAGIVVLGVSVAGLQLLSGALYPLPAGVELGSPQFDAFVERLPVMAWLFVFGSEILGAALGAYTAGRIARDHARAFSAFIVALAALASVANWMSFDHPPWFVFGQLFVYPVALTVVWVMLERPTELPREAVSPEAA